MQKLAKFFLASSTHFLYSKFVPSIIKSCYESNTNIMNPIDSPECGGITNNYSMALMPNDSYIPTTQLDADSISAMRSTISEFNNLF
jgi:hypothetical protein